jgi:hypothetical protein
MAREKAVMLRITRIAGPEPATTLKIEGKLIGPWVGALRETCDSGGPVRLDLSAVNFVDPDGVKLLRELLARGMTLAGCSGLVAELLHAEAR